MKRHSPAVVSNAGEADAKRVRTSLDDDATEMRLQHFIQVNSLDDRCSATLRELTTAQQNHIMNQEFVVQIDPRKGNASALVVGRCKQAKRDPVEHSPEANLSLAEFVAVNGLDERCAETLRGLTEEQLQWVMSHQFVVQVDPSRGSASALVIGRCKKAKALYPGTAFASAAHTVSHHAVPFAVGPGLDHTMPGADRNLQWQPPQTVNHISLPVAVGPSLDHAMPSAGGEVQRQLNQYIMTNNLDDRCAETLRGLTEEQLRWVIDQEFVVQVDPSKGSASALVVGRCKKVKAMDSIPSIRPLLAEQATLAPLVSPSDAAILQSQLEQFITVNGLDDGCIRMLRALPEEQLKWVMAQEFVVQADPAKGSASALVVGRCKKAGAIDVRQSQVPSNTHLQAQLEQFILWNSLDERCAALLRELSEEQLQWVMNQEFVVQADPGRGSTSAVVVGRCKRAKTIDLRVVQPGHHNREPPPATVGSHLANYRAFQTPQIAQASAAVSFANAHSHQSMLAYASEQPLQTHSFHSGAGGYQAMQTHGSVGHAQSQLELFISTNSLDARCAEMLRELSEEQQQWVMAQEFVVEADPSKGSASALVVGRCIRAKILDMKSSQVASQAGMPPIPNSSLPAATGPAIGQLQYSQYSQPLDGFNPRLAQVAPAAAGNSQSRLEQFILANALDESCAEKLCELSPEQLNWVMEQEFVVQIDPSKGNASALVVGRCKRAKAIDFSRSQASPSPIGGSVDSSAGQLQSRLQTYISLNGLDDRCVAMLRELSDEQLQWVLDQELVVQVDLSRGNASALVVGRCKKAKSIDFTRLRVASSAEALQGAAGHFQAHLAQFISQNNLDDRCAGILRTMPEEQANWVMDQEFIVRVDPSKGSASGLVVGRCKRAGALASTGRSLAPQVSSTTGIGALEPHDQRLRQFVAVNNLDERCAATLQTLSQFQASWVMDQEFVVQVDPAKGNASALVVGRCNKAKGVAMTSADSSASHALRLQQFVALNMLDDTCAASLQHLTETQAKLVMDQEFHVQVDHTQGSASNLVLERCNNVRAPAAAVLQSPLPAYPGVFLV